MSYKAWLYHSEKEPKIFDGDEAIKEALDAGWKDNPAKCEGFLDKVGVDKNNKLQVQYIAEVADQSSEVVNLIENLNKLDKKGVIRLADLHFAEDWSEEKAGVKKLRARARKRLDADNVIEH